MNPEGWALVAMGLGLAELLVGGFWMLVIAVAAALAGVVAWAGGSGMAQGLTAGLVTTAGAGLLAIRTRRRATADVATDPSVHLDVGECVDVTAWDAQGRTVVRYRGSDWQATLASPDARPARAARDLAAPAGLPDHDAVPTGFEARGGLHRIAAVQGNRLVLEPVQR